MPKLTIELPDEIYRKVIALPSDEREERIIAAFATAPNREKDPPLSQEDLDSIGRGLAEVDAGHARPMSEFFAELRTEPGKK